MKLSFNVIGIGELWSLQFEEMHREADVVTSVVEAVEKRGTKALKAGIKKMSGFWVDWMMR